MWKSILVGTAALAVAGAALVHAQDRPRGPHMERWGGPAAHHQLSPDDIRAFTDARIAGLKAGLALTPDQDKNWPPFEQAMRDLAKDRLDRMEAQGNAPGESDPIVGLQRRADAVTRRGTLLKQLAASAALLYQSLDDAQKRRFLMLARFGRSEHMRGHWRDHGDDR